ncbi:MAG: Tar ligand binding domain-containing protein, partial [Usitatibacteraceae bacterium]
MRLNMPVTQREVELKDGETIVSKTNTKGVITYCNQTFLDISGFSQEEVMGKPHNLVRHPDMPPAAFEDFWNTLKSGRPWSGMVKNRCKNGDHYWVYAEASPVYEDGTVTGYLSVRFKPARSEIDAADTLYRSMREQAGNGVAIRGGQLVRAGTIAGLVRRFTTMSIKSRLAMLAGMMSLMLASGAGVGLYGINSANEAALHIYEDGVLPIGQLGETQKLLLRNRLLLATALATPTPEVIKVNSLEIESNAAEIDRIWTLFAATPMKEEQKKRADKVAEDRTRFAQQGIKPAVAALRLGDVKEANRIIVDAIRPLSASVDEGLVALMKFEREDTKLQYQASVDRYVATRNLTILALVLGIIFACAFGYLMVVSIMRGLSRATSIAEAVSRGKFDTRVGFSPNDEFGKLTDA